MTFELSKKLKKWCHNDRLAIKKVASPVILSEETIIGATVAIFLAYKARNG